MNEGESRSWMSCLGWGCLVVVVVAVLGIGACVAIVYRGGSAAHEVADAYLEAVDAGRFEDAFGTLGPEFTSARDLAALVEFERANREAFGPCGEWRLSGTAINREDGRTTATLSYRSECDSGPLAVRFVVERIGGLWLIQDIEYREPGGPLPVATCGDCGGVLPPAARFCPLCGAPVGLKDQAPAVEPAPTGPAE